MPTGADLNTREPGCLEFSFTGTERVIAARVTTTTGERIRLHFLSAPAGPDLTPETLRGLLPEDVATRSLGDVPQPADEAATTAGLNVSALFGELTAENCFPATPEEDLSAYCTMVVSSHGFPAGVLVRGDQFLLPGRSGLPLGVVGQSAFLIQNIDIEPGDDFYLHSDLTHVGELRRLHKGLTEHAVPADFTEAGLCVIRMSFT